MTAEPLLVFSIGVSRGSCIFVAAPGLQDDRRTAAIHPGYPVERTGALQITGSNFQWPHLDIRPGEPSAFSARHFLSMCRLLLCDQPRRGFLLVVGAEHVGMWCLAERGARSSAMCLLVRLEGTGLIATASRRGF
jgi:hypothetical protein